MPSKPRIEDLLTGSDVARIAGISNQRVHQLLNADQLPKPIGSLGRATIWWRPDVEKWAATRDPRSGRKPRTSVQ